MRVEIFKTGISLSTDGRERKEAEQIKWHRQKMKRKKKDKRKEKSVIGVEDRGADGRVEKNAGGGGRVGGW